MTGVLSACKEIEFISEKIYRTLAANQAYAPEIRKCFQQLSSDEQSHGRQIDLLLQTKDFIKINAVTRISGEKVDEVLRLAEKILSDVERKSISEEEALNFSIKMEQEFIKIHAHNALHFYDKRLADFFDDLGSADLHHLNSLKELMRWWVAGGKDKKTAISSNH
jgi:rubrerythrin